MSFSNYAAELSIGLFGVTVLLLLAASREGRTRLGRVLAWSSIASVCGANYSMIMSYNGEPSPIYERPGPIERRVIQRRGQFEYVDKEDGESSGGSGGSSSSSTAASGGSEGPGEEQGAGGSGSGKPAQRSLLASLISQASAAPAYVAANGQLRLGDIVKDCADCPDMVAVAPGYFRMGAVPGDTDASSAELPRRLVTAPRWYAIGRSEVTRGQYMAFVKATGRAAPACSPAAKQDDLAVPVTCVSQADALAYINSLRISSGIAYRLPTEIEWEWAARGGVEQRFLDGPQAPAKRPLANAIGMAGIHGGVAERVSGCWSSTLTGAGRNAASPQRQTMCRFGIVRDAATSEPVEHARLSSRRPSVPDHRAATIGFRVARDL